VPDGLHFDTSGFTELDAKIARLIELVRDLRPFWPLIIPLYVEWEGQQFDSGGEFWGDPWAELTPDYAAWKTEHYPGRGILMAEGDLRHAAQSPRRVATATTLLLTIEPFQKQRGPGAGRRIDPSWFQEGTDTMVARPLLPTSGLLTAAAEAEISEAANRYFQEMMRRVGL
jgi:hypothetical protein